MGGWDGLLESLHSRGKSIKPFLSSTCPEAEGCKDPSHHLPVVPKLLQWIALTVLVSLPFESGRHLGQEGTDRCFQQRERSGRVASRAEMIHRCVDQIVKLLSSIYT